MGERWGVYYRHPGNGGSGWVRFHKDWLTSREEADRRAATFRARFPGSHYEARRYEEARPMAEEG